jgi:hypothetical protein
VVVWVNVNDLVLDARLDGSALAEAGDADGETEGAKDYGANGSVGTNLAAGNHIGDQAAVTVSQVSQRNQGLVTGENTILFDGIARSKDVWVTRALLVIDPQASGHTNLEASFASERVVWVNASGGENQAGIDLPAVGQNHVVFGDVVGLNVQLDAHTVLLEASV